jgi:hypothetical protein
MSEIDHLVYVAPDLEVGVDRLERLVGVRAVPGGRHPRWGTRNALLSLGPDVYLEILAPDPERGRPERPTLFGLDELKAPRLATWAAKASDLERRVEAAAAEGVRLGEIVAGSRETPDGSVLSWRLTDPAVFLADGVMPFLIDWSDSRHPATDAPGGCSLTSLRAEHPEPARVAAMLEAIGSVVPVETGASPVLIATIVTPSGEIELK